jgi:LacI family transcriptional regulator
MSATMSDIAARAGTSVAAVSVTLNGAKSKTLKVGDDTRGRIIRAAEELGYRRNPLASALATGRSKVIGVMLPYASAYADHDPFFWLLTTGIAAYASRHGYSLLLFAATAEEGDRAARMIDKLVAGIILVSPPTDSPLYGECERQGIPYVAIFGNPRRAAVTLNSADYEGGRIATRHLIDLGHRRIAHLLGRPGIVTTEPRRRGYEDALREAGIVPDPGLCLDGNFDRLGGYRATRKLLERPPEGRPTAIFASNDLSAHGAVEAAADARLEVPRDLAVVGYDDTWYATVVQPALTSVNMDVSNVGEQATRSLLDRIEGTPGVEAHLVLPVSLHVRESSGAFLQ